MKNTFLIMLLKICNLVLHTITLGIPKLTKLITNKIIKLENKEA